MQTETSTHRILAQFDENGWDVSLPHQCDEWTITYGTTKTEALEEIDSLIAELTQIRNFVAEGK